VFDTCNIYLHQAWTKCKWQNDRERLHFLHNIIHRKILEQTVQSGGSKQKGARCQLWGTWSVIIGRGSQTRGAGSEIGWDPPPQFNRTPVYAAVRWQSKLINQTFNRSVGGKNRREIKRQQIGKDIHHCHIKIRSASECVATISDVIDLRRLIDSFRFYRKLRDKSHTASDVASIAVGRLQIAVSRYTHAGHRCRYLRHDLLPFNCHSSKLC